MTYELVRHAGPGDFLQRAESWLLASEAEHNLHLSLAYVRRDAGATGADVLFGTVEQDGDLVGCVIRTPPHKVLITSMPPEAAPDIVGPVAELYDEIPAVLGQADSAVAVASAWTALKGGGWETGMQQRIYRLDQVEPVRPVPGAMRLATMDDLELLTDWGTGFARDAGHAFLLAREQVNRMIERQDLHIWQDESPASMAVAQGATPNGCRIGYVYTPPELRGRGYASALVARLSQRMLDSGMTFCVLYTDLGNPTPNAIYQRIGYNAICDVRDIDIVSALR
ncbi:MAG: GNAT family N-acetyltransferase [Gemmatimonadetes bacterium]|nr:GNAT family N-acetyltransferase [Gemmatimonadota bacterium]